MADRAGISDGEKARDTRPISCEKSFGDSDETYGYRRVHADLAAWGVPAGPELVRSVMRELGLEPCQPRPWRFSLTEGDGQEHGIPDLVNRDFTAAAPGRENGRRHHVYPDVGGLGLPGTVNAAKVSSWAMDDNYKTPIIDLGGRRYLAVNFSFEVIHV